jgi:hypothetical protein
LRLVEARTHRCWPIYSISVKILKNYFCWNSLHLENRNKLNSISMEQFSIGRMEQITVRDKNMCGQNFRSSHDMKFGKHVMNIWISPSTSFSSAESTHTKEIVILWMIKQQLKVWKWLLIDGVLMAIDFHLKDTRKRCVEVIKSKWWWCEQWKKMKKNC